LLKLLNFQIVGKYVFVYVFMIFSPDFGTKLNPMLDMHSIKYAPYPLPTPLKEYQEDDLVLKEMGHKICLNS
jgi:hypothetical protein